MNKKLLFSFIILFSIAFSFDICFANQTMNTIDNITKDSMNNVGNFIEGTENAFENTGKNILNNSKNVTNNVEKGMNNIMSSTGNYISQRTSSNTEETLIGMNQNTWTWLIVGITSIAIIAIIWYYLAQNTNLENHYED